MSHRRALKSGMRCLSLALGLTMLLSGCAGRTEDQMQNLEKHETDRALSEAEEGNLVSPTAEIVELEDGLLTVRHDGDYGFDAFLAKGGASSDGEVIEYLASSLLSDFNLDDWLTGAFGCSTIAVRTPEGDALFGRNFDWQNCEAMIVESHPEEGYASLSTVNMDFITQNVGVGMMSAALNSDEIKTLAALYAPLDGMNEAGLAVSVNMIQDNAAIEQDTDRPDITTTTAIRLLLDKAGSVDEALELLGQYDLHGSMGMMVHFAIADSTGRSVAVVYVDNEMIVIETPVLTNFYLAAGEKQGIGTAQSHERYDMLMHRLEATPRMTMEDVRNALDSVSKDQFGEFESTEWSAVMNLSAGEVRYYHWENYNRGYTFRLKSR